MTEQRIGIGDWVAEPGLNTIRKGKRVAHLEPKTMDVLAFLARHPGQVLDRERILDAVWPDTYVGDGTLTYAIVGLRKALGDNSKEPRYIQTIPKRGYRLIAPVTLESASEKDAESGKGKSSFFDWENRYLRTAVGVFLLVLAVWTFRGLFEGGVVSPYLSEPAFYVLEGENSRPLSSGEEVRPGDELFVELESARDLYVYVLNQDEQGESYLLFPQPEYERTNPVPAGQGIRLPGPSQGEELVWQVSSAGGREHFLVVTSEKRLPELESNGYGFSNPDFSKPVTLADSGSDDEDPSRGVGRLKRKNLDHLDPAPTPPFQAILSHLQKDKGVWIHRFELENRGN